MFNKLKSRLILLIMGGAIFAIALVSIITNVTLFNQFDIYMATKQDKKIDAVVDMIYKAYITDGYWSNKVLQYISLSPLTSDFDIVIKDSKDSIIFEDVLDDTMVSHHNRMMQRMGHGMMRKNYSNSMDELAKNEDYVKTSYTLNVDNNKIGTVDIGYVGPFYVSESDVIFTEGINRSIFYAALISILASIILGLYSSKVFSKPILKITKVANDIRDGKLDTKVDENNNIIELRELSKSINHLSKSLGEQELLRKRLTSDISHELRTPLTVLQSHIEAIIDGVWEPTEERLNVCKNEVVRLIKLVEELKYLTDIDNRKIILENKSYNLSREIIEVVEGFKSQFIEKEITLNSNIMEDIFLVGDRDKIKQVIINLLSNALKFTNIGGRVEVKLEDNGNEVVITVNDNGIGVDKKDIPYLFERLYRSDISRNRKTGGTGIGLTITKSLIEAHGGRIEVESEKDRGTKVIVKLPKKVK